MVFESNRSGTTHRYELKDDALYYSAGTKTQLRVEWTELRKIAFPTVWGQKTGIYLIPKNRQKLGLWLDPKVMDRFLPELFSFWQKKDRWGAAKAAFDYGNQDKVVGWVWLISTLLFPVLLSVLLLADGLNTLRCDQALQNGKLATANLKKVSKNRRGNFLWTLEFATEAGKTIKGTRAAYVFDEKGYPKSDITIVYAGDQAQCWDVSMKSHELALNKTQRHFTLFMTLSFGIIFAFVGIIALYFSLQRVRIDYPHQETIRQIAEKLRANPTLLGTKSAQLAPR